MLQQYMQGGPVKQEPLRNYNIIVKCF